MRKVVLLPTIPYGTETNQMAFPLAMNVNPSTLFAVITRPGRFAGAPRHPQNRAAQQPRRQRFEAAAARAVRQDAGAVVSVQLVSRADRRAARRSSSIPTIMPAKWKPSLGLAYFPELVARTPDGTLTADDGAVQPTRFEAVNRGWVSITRPWHLLDHQHRRRQSARRHRRKRPAIDGFSGRTIGDVLGRTFRRPV